MSGSGAGADWPGQAGMQSTPVGQPALKLKQAWAKRGSKPVSGAQPAPALARSGVPRLSV